MDNNPWAYAPKPRSYEDDAAMTPNQALIEKLAKLNYKYASKADVPPWSSLAPADRRAEMGLVKDMLRLLAEAGPTAAQLIAMQRQSVHGFHCIYGAAITALLADEEKQG